MEKVICIGSLNVDNILFVDNIVGEDSEEIIRKIKVFSGGQAGNIAAGLGKLGKKAYFFGNVGKDMHTKMLTDDFDLHNVDYSYAKKTNKPNNYLFSLVNKNGERAMYAYNNVDISFEDFKDEFLKDTKFIIFTSLIKENIIDLYVNIAIRAKKKGIKIVLDPGNILSKEGLDNLKPLLELCDYFIPSLSDIKVLGGMEIVPKISDLVPNVIITCGEDGAKYFKKGKEITFSTKKIKKEDISNTIGAGDCFVAAFVSSLLEGETEEEAINFANHAAALSIMKEGARSMPSYEKIKEFMNGEQ